MNSYAGSRPLIFRIRDFVLGYWGFFFAAGYKLLLGPQFHDQVAGMGVQNHKQDYVIIRRLLQEIIMSRANLVDTSNFSGWYKDGKNIHRLLTVFLSPPMSNWPALGVSGEFPRDVGDSLIPQLSGKWNWKLKDVFGNKWDRTADTTADHSSTSEKVKPKTTLTISVIGYHSTLALEIPRIWKVMQAIYELEFDTILNLEFAYHILETPWEVRDRWAHRKNDQVRKEW